GKDRYRDLRNRYRMLGDWRRLRQYRGDRVHQGGEPRARSRNQLFRYRRGLRLWSVGGIAGKVHRRSSGRSSEKRYSVNRERTEGGRLIMTDQSTTFDNNSLNSARLARAR